jgi:thiamine pyrophosphokinase
MKTWNTDFLKPTPPKDDVRRALIILNQPFSFSLLHRLWTTSEWRCCADGGANRLYDVLGGASNSEVEPTTCCRYLPDLIKGDLDSLRGDVRKYYASQVVVLLAESLLSHTPKPEFFFSRVSLL